MKVNQALSVVFVMMACEGRNKFTPISSGTTIPTLTRKERDRDEKSKNEEVELERYKANLKEIERLKAESERLKAEGEALDKTQKKLHEENQHSRDLLRKVELTLEISELKEKIIHSTEAEMKANRPNYREDLERMEKELKEIDKRLESKQPN